MSTITLSKIEKAIDALLRAIVENEARLSAAGQARAIYIVTAAEVDEGDVIAEDLDGIVADPVGVACRSEVASLGSLLFETIGTTAAPADVLQRVAEMDLSNINQRRAILDEVWAHVGPEATLTGSSVADIDTRPPIRETARSSASRS